VKPVENRDFFQNQRDKKAAIENRNEISVDFVGARNQTVSGSTDSIENRENSCGMMRKSGTLAKPGFRRNFKNGSNED
jgi:hypothetical protein